MSLVTRCSTCGTVFRVVQDQLKISSGWVRCGRCGEVFNALQTLFDLERDGPVLPPPSAAAGPPAAPPEGLRPSRFIGLDDEPADGAPMPDHRVLRGAAPPSAPPAPLAVPAPIRSPIPGTAWGLAPPPGYPLRRPDLADDDRADAETPRATAPPRSAPVSEEGSPNRALPGPTVFDSTVPHVLTTSPAPDLTPLPVSAPRADNPPDEDAAPVEAGDSSRPALADGRSIWPTDSRPAAWIEPALDSASAGDAVSDSRQMVAVQAPFDGEAPAFLREDERRRRAESPVRQGLLGFAALALAALLVGQWALHQRDQVADLWPWSRPLLAQACRVSGCTLLEAPRRLDAFTVESTTLTRAAAGTSAYRLSITLRNRSARPATLPSVELALTDTDGQLLARRALHPSDFRIQRPVVPGGADTTLQLLMTAPRDRVNGYTIEIFYP